MGGGRGGKEVKVRFAGVVYWSGQEEREQGQERGMHREK